MPTFLTSAFWATSSFSHFLAFRAICLLASYAKMSKKTHSTKSQGCLHGKKLLYKDRISDHGEKVTTYVRALYYSFWGRCTTALRSLCLDRATRVQGLFYIEILDQLLTNGRAGELNSIASIYWRDQRIWTTGSMLLLALSAKSPLALPFPQCPYGVLACRAIDCVVQTRFE